MQNNEWIKEHLAEGTQTGEYRITGEYSYRNRYCSTDGLVLAGDALGFLDPVFSSGVFLALKSGVMLADEIDTALKSGDCISSLLSKIMEDECSHPSKPCVRLFTLFTIQNSALGTW